MQSAQVMLTRLVSGKILYIRCILHFCAAAQPQQRGPHLQHARKVAGHHDVGVRGEARDARGQVRGQRGDLLATQRHAAHVVVVQPERELAVARRHRLRTAHMAICY